MTAILYGALAKPPSRLRLTQRIKKGVRCSLYLQPDFRSMQAGHLSTHDYRNSGRHQSTNIGDRAISEAITLALSSQRSDLTLEPNN